MEIVYIWVGLAALLSMRLIREVGSFGRGWATLSNVQKSEKVLTESRDATYYRGKGSPRDETGSQSMQEVRQIVWQRDNGLCVHCGAQCYLGKRTVEDLSLGRVKGFLGHWVANALGGPEVPDNLHISCVGCNSDMGSNIILQPAINFAASRKETICIEGLEIHEGVYRITELLERKAA